MMPKRGKKDIKIPFTPEGDLITWLAAGYDHTWEIAGDRRDDINVSEVVWKRPEECKFKGTLLFLNAYTGRSRARVEFKVVGTGVFIEMPLDDFNELVHHFGMQGKQFPSVDCLFVKRGQNFLCKPDWDLIRGVADPTAIRTAEGYINNCALANGAEEPACQICKGDCPDRAKFK